ncbi:protein-glutamine gamma-glutamyltransferase 2-like isoform X2 [Antennarius striatus]|uniref:protein-glutamine gamma-glutamyltransferase 2-like isoform X2 n=1 Tax=Antennarius striatus TaxID=241820 RepID=UPI0035AE34F4
MLVGCGDQLADIYIKDPEVFPGQPRDVVPPARPRSPPRSLPGRTCQEHLPREASRRHPEQMPEPRQLELLEDEDPRLYSELLLGDMSERIPVQLFDKGPNPPGWSAKIYPGDMRTHSATIHVCSSARSSVGLYHLLVHMETISNRKSFVVGKFVLLCNPWLREDPVYMPLDVQIQEYMKSDYGIVYMGTPQNICRLPWSFGQYEPGVLEACLQILQVSPQHLSDKRKDYILRADPAYLSRVICAMVNCNDDLGILRGKWQGSYKGGVKPTEWIGSADILHRWVASNCSPVSYGQCWVFASVLCTVMRVLGIPSRVVTVFNAAHDTDGSRNVEEYYSTKGEKLNLSKDSIWNFHVWVESWMRRPDLSAEFDGWQVVDPTPQEKSAGVFCCGPCPVTAIQQHFLNTQYDSSFVHASVDADIVRLIVRNGHVVGRMVESEWVGQLIYTKSIGSDKPENLTHSYKSKKMFTSIRSPLQSRQMLDGPARISPSVEVSLNVDGVPSVGDSIIICVTVANKSSRPRVLVEHLDAQLKEYNRNPRESFWRTHKLVHIQAGEVLKLCHTILPSEYEAVLAGNDIVNVAVVLKDVRTKERFLAVHEFSVSSPLITIQIEGGNNIQMKKEYTTHVSFINMFPKILSGAVLTVEGFGLLQYKHRSRLVLLQPGHRIVKTVSIMATSPGTKLLMATFTHSSSPGITSRSFHKVSVQTE